MQVLPTISLEEDLIEFSPHPYYDWVSKHFVLLSCQNFEQTFGLSTLKKLESAQKEAIPKEIDSRIVIQVDQSSTLYAEMAAQAFAQFDQLCEAAHEDSDFGVEARQFLSYLVMSHGYPAYQVQMTEMLSKGATVIRELMKTAKFRTDLHSTVSGVVAYSIHANPEVRLLMLDALCEYFDESETDEESLTKPSRRELSTILFDAFTLELRRQKSSRNEKFHARLLELLEQHPHPALEAVLTCLVQQHSDLSLRVSALKHLNKLQFSLQGLWDKTTADQVSSLEYRAQALRELNTPSLTEVEKAQGIFNSCKGLGISSLTDPRLPELNNFLCCESETIRLASALALGNIYIQTAKSQRLIEIDLGKLSENVLVWIHTSIKSSD